MCRLFWNLGASNFWNPPGSVQACNGIDLAFTTTTNDSISRRMSVDSKRPPYSFSCLSISCIFSCFLLPYSLFSCYVYSVLSPEHPVYAACSHTVSAAHVSTSPTLFLRLSKSSLHTIREGGQAQLAGRGGGLTWCRVTVCCYPSGNKYWKGWETSSF